MEENWLHPPTYVYTYERARKRESRLPVVEQDAREEVTVLMSSVNLAKTALWAVSFA